MYPQFQIFGRTIGTYGLCAILGLAVCVAAATGLTRKRQIAFDDVVLLALAIVGGVLVGGHLLFGLTQVRTLCSVLSQIGKVPYRQTLSGVAHCFGGAVFYGGFLGGLAAGVLYAKKSTVFSSIVAAKVMILKVEPGSYVAHIAWLRLMTSVLYF